MAITVLLREPQRGRAGTGSAELPLPPDGTLGALLVALVAAYPALGTAADLQARNEFFIGDRHVPHAQLAAAPLHDGDTVIVAADLAGG